VIEVAQHGHEPSGHELHVHVAVVFQQRLACRGRQVAVIAEPIARQTIRQIEVQPERTMRTDVVERLAFERLQRSQAEGTDQPVAICNQRRRCAHRWAQSSMAW
jgi:hypothetical protein